MNIKKGFHNVRVLQMVLLFMTILLIVSLFVKMSIFGIVLASFIVFLWESYRIRNN